MSDPLSDQTGPPFRPLPERVVAILRDLGAPPRLVATQLVDALEELAPALTFDREEVLVGGAGRLQREVSHLPFPLAFEARLGQKQDLLDGDADR